MESEIASPTALESDFLRSEFRSAFERIWHSQIARPLAELTQGQSIDDMRSWVAGVAWIGGQWTGSVTIALPRNLATEITAQLLEIPGDQVKSWQVEDAVREITNMSAGNFKSVLPSPSGLATPGFFLVESRADLANNFRHLLSVEYRSSEYAFIIELHGLL